MMKEFLISLYLFCFRISFNLFKWFPLQNKVTFVVSFGTDSVYIYEEMRRQNLSSDVVFLYKGNSLSDLGDLRGARVIAFETLNIVNLLRAIYHLATSKQVFIDNYYGFLSVVDFKEDVECIQLWHAAGALKRFGLKDRSVLQRSQSAQKRFLNVYKKFNKVVVGSESMAKVFIEAFNLSPESILRTGIPRTDLFYDKRAQDEMISELTTENPDLKNKKVILYAPTYRDGQLNQFEIKLDLDLMEQELGREYILLLRLHPAIKNVTNYEKRYPGFIYDTSSFPDVNRLLLVTDVLVTDYSSIPYEFALLNKPMVFYPYDLDEYKEQRGLWGDYESIVPGPIVHSTREMVEKIKENAFDLNKIQLFAQNWNRYSKGKSSRNIVDYIIDKDKLAKEQGERSTL